MYCTEQHLALYKRHWTQKLFVSQSEDKKQDECFYLLKYPLFEEKLLNDVLTE